MNTAINLKNISFLLLFVTIIFLSESCGTKAFGLHADSLFLMHDQSEVYYELKHPDEKYFLPYVLSEISGLSYRQSGNLLAVDDETGKIFEYSTSKKEIVHSIEFSNPGDYEGVEIVSDKVFVLESDGDLYAFDYSTSKKSRARKYENDLSRENDTEGLGYDPVTGTLLIVCKEDGEIEKNGAKGRAIYSFDINQSKLSKDPLFTIRPKDLKFFWEQSKAFSYEEDRIKFKPSGIAFHPIEERFYVLSSVGKLLVVMNRDGSIQATYPISARVLGQPEGICFAPNGDLYISSEGEGDRGYILKYEMKKR